MDERRCPVELRDQIFNLMVTKYRDPFDALIRMNGNVVRAVLSKSYSIFDHTDFIDLIEQAVSTMGIEPLTKRVVIGDDMKAYVIFPQVTFAPDPTDHSKYGDGGLHPAMYIGNSERGGGCARVVGAVFRDYCQNGLIYGWSDTGVFETRHRFHSKMAMGLLVAEGIATALRMSEEATKKFIESQEIKVIQPTLAPLVDAWATRYGLTIESKEAWTSLIHNEAVQYGRPNDVRLFDIVNAATYLAQQKTDADSTEDIERMAGAILAYRPNSTARTV